MKLRYPLENKLQIKSEKNGNYKEKKRIKEKFYNQTWFKFYNFIRLK